MTASGAGGQQGGSDGNCAPAGRRLKNRRGERCAGRQGDEKERWECVCESRDIKK